MHLHLLRRVLTLTLLLKDVKLAWYVTNVSKTKGGSKQPIYGKMVRAEATGSTPRRRDYLEDTLNISSEHVLRIFAPETYLVKVGTAAAQNKLLKAHVIDLCQFAVSAKRYLSFVVKNGGLQNV